MTIAFVEDIRRCTGGNRKLLFRLAVRAILHDYGLQALMGYRLGRFLIRSRWQVHLWPLLPLGWLLYFLWSRYVRLAYDICLRLSADIGPGLRIWHFGGVHLDRCKLGEHCSISHSTQIHPGDGARGPVLGDRVWVGAHAKVIGPYVIGNGSTVGAAATVTKDIPGNTLCMGNPARVVKRDYDNTIILALT